MKELTERQKEILDFIAQFTDDNAYAPTVREICDHFNISIRAVQDHVAALQKKGYLSVTRHRSRSMRVLNDPRSKNKCPAFIEVPVIISGDAKDLLERSNVSGAVYRSTSYIVSGKLYFAFHADDDSMKDAGIFDGDLVIAEKTESCREGQIAVVCYEGRILIRRAVRENDRLCYKAGNDYFAPVYAHQVKLLGVLAEISRSY